MRKICRYIATGLLTSLCVITWSRVPAAGVEYQRIVSLAPSITKSICLLGLRDRIAGATLYCPTCTPRTACIGTILKPDIETIAALKPDIVIAIKEGNDKRTVERLREMGIYVYVMEPCNSFEDINRGFLSLAHALGRDKTAQGIVADARRRVDAVRSRKEGGSHARIFWEVGAQPLFTVSRKSYVHFFMEYAGGENIFADSSTRYPQVSREEVVRLNPDIIILVTMGDVTQGEKKYWQSFPSLKAASSGRIYVLPGPLFTDPTPSAFAEGVEKIAELIHTKADAGH